MNASTGILVAAFPKCDSWWSIYRLEPAPTLQVGITSAADADEKPWLKLISFAGAEENLSGLELETPEARVKKMRSKACLKFIA